MTDAIPAASEAFRHAISACRKGDLARAEQRCWQILAAQPDFFDALRLLAFVQLRLGKREAALASYDRAIALRPDHADAHYHRGVVLSALKRVEEALASYDRAIEARPHHAEAWFNRANILHELKRFEEAVASYDRAVAAQPNHAGALSNRGVCLLTLKRYEQAVASFDRAIVVKPDYAAAFHNRAGALQQLKRFDEALASYERALSLQSGHAAPPSDRRAGASTRAVLPRRTAPHDKLTVLSYCGLNPVGLDAVGGAEQVLSMLDRALVEAGHRSIVVACDGSRVAGTLVAVPRPPAPLDRAAALVRYRAAIVTAVRRWRVDLVHSHGLHSHPVIPVPGVPVLATLHLPLELYHPAALRPHPDTFLHCVSGWQHAACGQLAQRPHMLPPIENGIVVENYQGRHAKRGFALLLCRICPEKGVHLAIDAAKRAGVPLLIAGEVLPRSDWEEYFRAEVQPRLDRARRFIGPVGLARKRRLLAAARCLLLPSLTAETSSLVAREALAAGTPVVAFPAGALVDVVDHGRTGYLVEDVPQMSDAIAACADIDPALCRRVARDRFSARRMIEQYFSVYAALTSIQGGLRPVGP